MLVAGLNGAGFKRLNRRSLQEDGLTDGSAWLAIVFNTRTQAIDVTHTTTFTISTSKIGFQDFQSLEKVILG